MKHKLTLTAGVISLSMLLVGCSTSPSAIGELTSQSSVTADSSITDALGTYTTVKWNDPNEYDQLTEEQTSYAYTWTTEGFSSEEALSGKQFVLNWVSSQVLDSSLLDNPEAAESFREYASGIVGGNIGGQKQLEEGTLVYRLPNGLKAVRDGKPRLNKASTQFIAVTGYGDVAGGRYINIAGINDVTYRLTEESVLSWYKEFHPDMSDAAIRSKLNLTKGMPVSYDVSIDWNILVYKTEDASWKVAFSTTNADKQTLNGIKDLPELKPAVTTSDLFGNG